MYRKIFFNIVLFYISINSSLAQEPTIGIGTSGVILTDNYKSNSSRVAPNATSTVGWKTFTCSTIETYYAASYFRVVIKNTDNSYAGYAATSSYPNNWQALMIAACSRASKTYSIYYYNTSGNWNAIRF